MEIEVARFRELVKRSDAAKKEFEEARAKMNASTEAYNAAAQKMSAAANNLQDYVQDCAGDPKLGSYRR